MAWARLQPLWCGPVSTTNLHFYPQPGEGRRPFLEQAFATLEKQPHGLGAADLHVKASIHRALGQPVEALAAYRASLDQEPLQLARRYKLAERCISRTGSKNPFRNLLEVQMLQPENAQTRELMDAVKGKIAEGR